MTDIALEPQETQDAHEERPEEGPLRIRTADLLDVSYPKRMIELIVTPYEKPALVDWNGRAVEEVFSRGAYQGIQRRGNRRIAVNRDHDRGRPCGKVVALHPSRDEGLVAEIHISKTPLGDETLTLADDGVLAASAGYRPMKDGERWESRSRVRINRAWLGHVALTAHPAYEDASVLSVRAAPDLEVVEATRTATPNLDVVRGWLLEDRFGATVVRDVR